MNIKFSGYTLVIKLDDLCREWEVNILDRQDKFFKKVTALSFGEARDKAEEVIQTFIFESILKEKKEN